MVRQRPIGHHGRAPQYIKGKTPSKSSGEGGTSLSLRTAWFQTADRPSFERDPMPMRHHVARIRSRSRFWSDAVHVVQYTGGVVNTILWHKLGGTWGRVSSERGGDITGRWMTGTFSCHRLSCHLKTNHDDIISFLCALAPLRGNSNQSLFRCESNRPRTRAPPIPSNRHFSSSQNCPLPR